MRSVTTDDSVQVRYQLAIAFLANTGNKSPLVAVIALERPFVDQVQNTLHSFVRFRATVQEDNCLPLSTCSFAWPSFACGELEVINDRIDILTHQPIADALRNNGVAICRYGDIRLTDAEYATETYPFGYFHIADDAFLFQLVSANGSVALSSDEVITPELLNQATMLHLTDNSDHHTPEDHPHKRSEDANS